jgi:tetratricopeptide (TPR) repeat protein
MASCRAPHRRQSSRRRTHLIPLLFVLMADPSTTLLTAQSTSADSDRRVEQLYAAAKAAEARGDVAGAVSKYESMIEIVPGLGAAHNNLGALYFRQGEYRKAVEVLRQGLKVDPAMHSASALLGISLYKLGEHAAARPPLEAALRANPKDDHAVRFLAKNLMKLGEWQAAEARLQQLALLQPEDQETWYMLGTVYMELSKQALARMNEIDPDSSLAHQVSGEIMESMKNYDGALAEYKKSVEMAPDRPGAHYKLGNLYAMTAQWDAASREFQAELAIDSRNCLAQWRLGHILLEQNLNPEEALADVDKALAICPDLAPARLDRGRAALKLGRYHEALADLQAAAKASPDEPGAHFFLAQAYRGVGRVQDATQEMRIFAELEERARSATAQRARDVIRAKENPR